MNIKTMTRMRGEMALICVLMLLWPFSVGQSTDTHESRTAQELAIPPFAYKNYTQIKDALYDLQNDYPSICMVFDLGDSWEKLDGLANRDILALKISDNVTLEENEPEVLVVALEHAREWISSELALAIAVNLTGAYGADPRVSWIVDNREIWIVPVVNPDGLDYSLAHDEWWRKNMRDNGDGTFGVDINRNFGGAMNGDPAGDWGGVGSSHSTSDEIYCGPSAFSEPESQAVRDLVLSHKFQVAIDLHSYGDWVMWPWGYSSATTQDDTDLVRIGHEFASMNGYFPSQSIGLYPTTGDSLDWLYGGAGVYAFCFEVGDEFHPHDPSVVEGTIHRNIPALLEGMEIAGDRQERQFNITHDSIPVRGYSSNGFNISAEVTAARGVNTSATRAFYRTEEGPWKEVRMTRGAANDTYYADIPGVDVGTVVDYYFVSRDLGGVLLESPVYAPYTYHSFTVMSSSNDLPPQIAHEPKGVYGSNDTVFLDSEGIQILARTSDDHGIRSAVLWYRASGSLAFHKENMSSADSHNFSAVLASSLDSGAEYYIEVTDTAGQKVRAPSDAPASLFKSNNTSPRISPGLVFSKTEVMAHSGEGVTVNACIEDDFGVETAMLTVRSRGTFLKEIPMVLASGTTRNGTWSADITIDGPPGIDEVQVELGAFDGRAMTYLGGPALKVVAQPHEGLGSYAFILIPVGAAGIVALAIVVSRFNRARRF